jgi:hypothetical protein
MLFPPDLFLRDTDEFISNCVKKQGNELFPTPPKLLSYDSMRPGNNSIYRIENLSSKE